MKATPKHHEPAAKLKSFPFILALLVFGCVSYSYTQGNYEKAWDEYLANYNPKYYQGLSKIVQDFEKELTKNNYLEKTDYEGYRQLMEHIAKGKEINIKYALDDSINSLRKRTNFDFDELVKNKSYKNFPRESLANSKSFQFSTEAGKYFKENKSATQLGPIWMKYFDAEDLKMPTIKIQLLNLIKPGPSHVTYLYVGKPVSNKSLKEKKGIKPYTAIWSQQVVEPSGNRRKGINTITDSVVVDTANGMKIIKRLVMWEDLNKNYYHRTDVLDYSTFKPLSTDIRWNPSYIQHTDFTDGMANTVTVNDRYSRMSKVEKPLDSLGYAWTSDGFILNNLTLDSPGAFAIPIINGLPDNPQLGTKDFHYLKDQTIEIDNYGTFYTKVIQDASSGSTATYWIVTRPPYIVKVEFQQANGQITTWNLETVR